MEVIVYTLPACVQCDSTKRYLSRNNISYREVNLMEDDEAMAQVKSLGYASAPVVMVGENNHWSGFRPDKLNELVA